MKILFSLCSDSSDLIFHIVGANVMEMLGIIKWEYVMHRLPKCQTLRCVFIGPELENEENGTCDGIQECPDCSDQGRKMFYEMRCMTYKQYKKDSEYTVSVLLY